MNIQIDSLTVRFVRMALFPLVLAGAVLGAVLGMQGGLPVMPLQFGSFLGTLLIVAMAERYIPDIRDPGGNDEWQVDAQSFGLLMAVVNPALEMGLPLLVAGLLATTSLPIVVDLFPDSWSLWIAVPVAALVADFGTYWLHRIAHEWPALWRFHASHHSSERLYWLNGFRVHPVNVVWHHVTGVLVLKLVGVGVEALIIYLVINGVVSAFQHGNLRLIHGPLNWVFSTNELHRWHHSALPEEGNRNYGGVLIVWDIVFGTYYRRADERPERYGLFAGNAFYPRKSYWGQLTVPITWNRVKAAYHEQ